MKYKKLLTVLFILGAMTLTPVLASSNTEAKLEYNKGIDFYKIGQYDKSMAAFRKAIELDPEFIDAYYNLGSILNYLGQDDAALTVFKQIIVRKPTDYDAVYKAAELSNKLGNPEQAKTFLALIPAGSYVNAKAQSLANSLNTDLQTIKYEQNKTEPPTQPSTNGVYQDIASPTGITTDIFGNLLVAGYSDNVIYKINPQGKRVIFLKDNKLNGPIGMVCDKAGNIYIANYNNNNVLKVDRNGFVSVLVSDILKPYGLHLSNGTLFISSQGANAVIRYKL